MRHNHISQIDNEALSIMKLSPQFSISLAEVWGHHLLCMLLLLCAPKTPDVSYFIDWIQP